MANNGFIVRGQMDYEVQIECDGAVAARRIVHDKLRVTLYIEDTSAYSGARRANHKYIEVTDSNVLEEETETEETEL